MRNPFSRKVPQFDVPPGPPEPSYHKILPTEIVLKHVYGERPPPPRPEQLTVTWISRKGLEYKTFIPFHGQRSWTENIPEWVMSRDRYDMDDPIISYRIDLVYL